MLAQVSWDEELLLVFFGVIQGFSNKFDRAVFKTCDFQKKGSGTGDNQKLQQNGGDGLKKSNQYKISEILKKIKFPFT